MGKMIDVRVLIGSAGRRIYLHDWFEQAFDRVGVHGEVHVLDADLHSAAFLRATHGHLLPAYNDPAYAPELLRIIEKIRPDLFFSVNDYEIAHLATSSLVSKIEERGTRVLGIPQHLHLHVHDKLQMATSLGAAGIRTPSTVLVSDADAVVELARSVSRIVIKDRFGSGSSGLLRASSANIQEAVAWATRADGGTAPDRLIAQPALIGDEFGLDIVTPLELNAHPVSVLARVKGRMRAGETDQATSVDPSPFAMLGQRIAAWSGHIGNMDVDVIVDGAGNPSVIDINPRFGGGYPFNHLAGADLPSLYVSQLSGVKDSQLGSFLEYRNGVTSSKYEAVIGVPR